MSDYFGYGVLGFGAGGGVVPITATGGDTVADYVGSDGFTYRYHQFTNTGNFVVVSLGSDETHHVTASGNISASGDIIANTLTIIEPINGGSF